MYSYGRGCHRLYPYRILAFDYKYFFSYNEKCKCNTRDESVPYKNQGQFQICALRQPVGIMFIPFNMSLGILLAILRKEIQLSSSCLLRFTGHFLKNET